MQLQTLRSKVKYIYIYGYVEIKVIRFGCAEDNYMKMFIGSHGFLYTSDSYKSLRDKCLYMCKYVTMNSCIVIYSCGLLNYREMLESHLAFYIMCMCVFRRVEADLRRRRHRAPPTIGLHLRSGRRASWHRAATR